MQVLLIDYVFIALGVAGIFAGLFGKNFYQGDSFTPFQRPASAAFAKPFFVIIGSLFLVGGFADLFGIWTLL